MHVHIRHFRFLQQLIIYSSKYISRRSSKNITKSTGIQKASPLERINISIPKNKFHYPPIPEMKESTQKQASPGPGYYNGKYSLVKANSPSYKFNSSFAYEYASRNNRQYNTFDYEIVSQKGPKFSEISRFYEGKSSKLKSYKRRIRRKEDKDHSIIIRNILCAEDFNELKEAKSKNNMECLRNRIKESLIKKKQYLQNNINKIREQNERKERIKNISSNIGHYTVTSLEWMKLGACMGILDEIIKKFMLKQKHHANTNNSIQKLKAFSIAIGHMVFSFHKLKEMSHKKVYHSTGAPQLCSKYQNNVD